MPLVRLTEKQLAASRANARKSKGPVTSAGKEKVSRNACKHHLYARKFLIHPEWEARIWDVVEPCINTVPDSVERASLSEYLVLKEWTLELLAFESRLFNESIERHRSVNRGIHAFAVHNSLFLAIRSRTYTLGLQAEKARIAWEKAKQSNSRKRSILHRIENTALTGELEMLTMAAGAGSHAAVPSSDNRASSQPLQSAHPASPRVYISARTTPPLPTPSIHLLSPLAPRHGPYP